MTPAQFTATAIPTDTATETATPADTPALADTPAAERSAPVAPFALLCIGGGNMATAMVGGLLKTLDRNAPTRAAQNGGLRIVVVEPFAQTRERWISHPALTVVESLDELDLSERFDLALLAVKPQQARDALQGATHLLARHDGLTLLSIAAGVRAQQLREWAAIASVARAMPNTPALIGEGITGLWMPADLPATTRERIVTVTRAAGECVIVDEEDDLDAVTALSGSGPAYVFYLVEAMADAGMKLGLARDTARRLALSTARGAAGLALQSDATVAELRRRVTSPGGTTEAAIKVLDDAGLRDTIEHALLAAHRRSRELSGR